MVLLQNDRRPLLLGQLLHRALDRARQILARDEILDRLRRLGRGREVHQIDVLGRLHHRRAPLAPHPVAAQIKRNPVEPRRELCLAAKTGKRAKCPEKRLLAHVSRIVLATDRAVRERVNRPLPS